jgi:hypothetical protein
VYIDIPEAGALFVGCPHYANTLMRLCRIRNKTTNEYRSAMTDSRSADPWLNWNWVYFDSKEQQAKICALSGGDDEYLRPWYGYRVWAYVPNIELRILGPG